MIASGSELMDRSMALHVIVLAAGQGKRMRSERAKVLLPVGGRPMLDHVLEAARALAPDCIHLVHGHRGEQLVARYAHQPGLRMVAQQEQLGTGHAVQSAMPEVPDSARVLVLLGDVPLIRSETLRDLLAAPASLAVLSVRLADPTGYGRVLMDQERRVQAIVEQKDASAQQLAVRDCNSGVIAADAAPLKRWLAALRPDNAQREYYLTDIFAIARNEGTAALAAPGMAEEVQGANDARQLSELNRLLELRAADALLSAGVRLARPEFCFVRGHVQAGSDVELDVHVVLEGDVVLGDGVRVGPFSRLKNCRLAAGTEVLAHCDLEGVLTTGPCRIGPFARLRPGTELAEGVHIGNFVETKQSRFALGSKANHLSYVGDADVGAGSNIGAGTITCNYDGVHKHRTEIGEHVFIGSNSALVAPVKIGAGATIGAGSVITKTAPPNQLTLARAPQNTLPAWKRPSKR